MNENVKAANILWMWRRSPRPLVPSKRVKVIYRAYRRGRSACSMKALARDIVSPGSVFELWLNNKSQKNK